MLFNGVEIGLLGEDLPPLQRRHAGINDQVGLEVQHPLDIAQGHIQHEPNAGRQRFQEPDVRRGAGEFNMPHALAAHLGLRHLDAALLTHHAAVLEALVLAAQTLVVLHRTKDLGAEQAIPLRLEGAVIDCFGLFDLSKRPRTDSLRGSQPNADIVEIRNLILLFDEAQQIFHRHSCDMARG